MKYSGLMIVSIFVCLPLHSFKGEKKTPSKQKSYWSVLYVINQISIVVICNLCVIRFSKLFRRNTASLVTASGPTTSTPAKPP